MGDETGNGGQTRAQRQGDFMDNSIVYNCLEPNLGALKTSSDFSSGPRECLVKCKISPRFLKLLLFTLSKVHGTWNY
jgi:hypothetical protein